MIPTTTNWPGKLLHSRKVETRTIVATEKNGTHTQLMPNQPAGTRKLRTALGWRTRNTINAINSSTSAEVFSRQMITTRLPKESAAKIAVIAQKKRMANFGTAVSRVTSATTLGSQPSHAMTNGNRETYSNWALNNDHMDTTPAAASRVPNNRPPISREITGQPASAFHTAESVVTLRPASTGSK